MQAAADQLIQSDVIIPGDTACHFQIRQTVAGFITGVSLRSQIQFLTELFLRLFHNRP